MLNDQIHYFSWWIVLFFNPNSINFLLKLRFIQIKWHKALFSWAYIFQFITFSFAFLKVEIKATASRVSSFPSFHVRLAPEPKESYSLQPIKMNQEFSLAQTILQCFNRGHLWKVMLKAELGIGGLAKIDIITVIKLDYDRRIMAIVHLEANFHKISPDYHQLSVVF